MRFKFYLVLIAVIIILPIPSLAQEADDLATFSSVAPDALIILDQSANMNLSASGPTMYISSTNTCGNDVAYYGSWGSAHSQACTINPAGTVPKFSNSTCSGPFYINTTRTGYDTDCSRLGIVKRALFATFDDNKNSLINSNDADSLGIRFGYMRFTACSADESDGYSAGCNKVAKVLGTKYSSIFCSSNSSCSPTSTGTNSISAAAASGGTPLVTSLAEAKSYLDYSKLSDSTSCRQKFVILITGGLDNYSCSGDGTDNQEDMYKRRRALVRKAQELADPNTGGYKLFVVNVGSVATHYMRNTLNWMAYYGATDNPFETNSGDISAFNPQSWGYCESSATAHHNLGAGDHFYAISGDPGEQYLYGYAFLSNTEDELKRNLNQISTIIRESTFSFSQVSVQSTRTQDENYLYEGSFQTVPNDPFWLGHLRKYALNADGTVGSEVWDAGARLQGMDAASRTMKTYLGGGQLADFNTTNVTLASLNVTTDTRRSEIIGFIRGESAYNQEYWKLGDVFRSTPITVGTPSAFFYDMNDKNKAFDQFRAAHFRTSTADNNKRIILTGANDGQMHAFHTSTGFEAWSFIPPNMLSKLQNIAHSTNPTNLSHAYFVDGPIGIADVWVGTTSFQYKSPTDWKTIMVISEGRGGHDTLWSSSPNCDSGFSSIFSSSYPYYCGYFALDITETLSPQYQWGRVSYTAPSTYSEPDPREYLGDPWSKVMIGKVLINGLEKWVGFVGAGYNGADCSAGGACDNRGKGFYIIDIATGAIIWSYTKANNSEMVYSLPANPSIVDSDSDGFIDTVYIGDLGGNMWRFKLCRGSEPNCTWSGGRLFQTNTASGIRPVYTSVAAARDPNRDLWVYWGTGDKTDPTASNAQEKLYAVKDNNRTTTYTIADLDNITTKTYDPTAKPAGWYMNFPGQGEKMLGDPTVFGGVIYMTTYTPSQGSDPCSQAGTGSLYALNYTSGSGILSGGQRSMGLGSGIPSPPIVSMKPGNAAGADLYVTTGGGSGQAAGTRRANLEPPGVANRTNVLFWRDKRVQ